MPALDTLPGRPYHLGMDHRTGQFARLLGAACGLLLGLACPAPVEACATCRVGDPTLTTFGLGQPFQQRLRVGARYDMRTTEIDGGTPDGFLLRHHELGLLVAYTPTTWLTLDADLPMARSQVTRANDSLVGVTSLGDATLGARGQLFTHSARGRNQHLWLNARLTIPSSPRIDDERGNARPLEEQTGTGAFVPQLGLGYAHLGGPVGGFVTVRAELPSSGFGQSRPGRGGYATLALQWQPWSFLGARISWEQAYEGSARELDGSVDPDSGGILWSAGFALLWAPTMDLVISLGGQLPVWQRLNGQHEERPVALASLIYDLGIAP